MTKSLNSQKGIGHPPKTEMGAIPQRSNIDRFLIRYAIINPVIGSPISVRQSRSRNVFIASPSRLTVRMIMAVQ